MPLGLPPVYCRMRALAVNLNRAVCCPRQAEDRQREFGPAGAKPTDKANDFSRASTSNVTLSSIRRLRAKSGCRQHGRRAAAQARPRRINKLFPVIRRASRSPSLSGVRKAPTLRRREDLTRSAISSTSLSLWLTKRMAIPRLESLASAIKQRRHFTRVSEAVGSSMMIRRASAVRARQMATSWRCAIGSSETARRTSTACRYGPPRRELSPRASPVEEREPADARGDDVLRNGKMRKERQILIDHLNAQSRAFGRRKVGFSVRRRRE